MNRIIEIKAQLFDINNSIQQLQMQGQNLLQQLQAELKKEQVKDTQKPE
jgi:hypothetical protein